MGFKQNQISGKILTIIGRDTFINGKLQGAGPIRVDGRINGELDVTGDLIIGEGAMLEAAVKGKNISVAGHIRGNIEALGKLEIMSTGVVEGDVLVQSLEVADGAIFRGACAMRKNEPKP